MGGARLLGRRTGLLPLGYHFSVQCKPEKNRRENCDKCQRRYVDDRRALKEECLAGDLSG